MTNLISRKHLPILFILLGSISVYLRDVLNLQSFLTYLTVFSFLALQYGLSFALLKPHNVTQEYFVDKRKKAAFLNCLVIAFLWGNLFIVFYTENESFVPFWDISNYWYHSIVLSKNLNENFWDAIRKVYFSIWYEEYNYLPCLLVKPFLDVFGMSLLSFKLAVFNMLIMPLIALGLVLIPSLLPESKTNSHYWILFVFLSANHLFSPVLMGYLDSIGLFYVLLLLYILIKEDLTQANYTRLFMISALLVLLSITRRWYLIWVVSYFFTLYTVVWIECIPRRENWKSGIRLSLAVLSFYVTTMLILFGPYFVRAFGTDYSYIHSAYAGTLKDCFLNIKSYWGIIQLGFLLYALNHLFKRFPKRMFLVLALNMVAAFCLFVRVQNFGMQHMYLFSIPFIFALSLAISAERKKIARVVLTSLLCLNYIFTYTSSKGFSFMDDLFSKAKFYPIHRSDMLQLQMLVDKVDQIIAQGKNVYMLSSSFELNEDILKKYRLPNKTESSPLFLRTKDVDKRDGFPAEILYADYIISADPIQANLNKNEQQIIVVFADMLNRGYGISKHYDKVDSVLLEKGLKVAVYKRKSVYAREDIDVLRKIFFQLYPKDKRLNTINFATSLIAGKTSGDGFGEVLILSGNRVAVHPGNTIASAFRLDLHKKFKHLNVEVYHPAVAQIENLANKDSVGSINLTISNNGRYLIHEIVDWRNPKKYSLDVSATDTLKFEIDKGAHGVLHDGFHLMLSDPE